MCQPPEECRLPLHWYRHSSVCRVLCLQGHYVPAFAAHIYHTNKFKDPSKVINLKGIAIGNGLTDPGACFRDRSKRVSCIYI